MSEKNINLGNQNIEQESALCKSPKHVAAAACLILATQVQAQEVLNEVKNPLLENNKSSLVVDSCERNINTDVILIKDSDGKQISKTLDRDQQPELTQYNLSDLSIVSNYDFEDKMYLHSKQTTTVNEDHPGNFSNIYDVSTFYTSNHVEVETPCEPGKDGETVERWEQKLISFDSMNDRDKELYFRLLNTLFLNAKINHTGWDLPDNMSRNKLEHIVTGLWSFVTRQLSIPNVNTEIKQNLEQSDSTISKYNLNIITELAYIENLLKGSKPKVIDRWDGVLYAIPDMSQNFMDFLATKDAEWNQFLSTEQINSILAIVDQLNDISVVEAAESVDYADVQKEYLSYFGKEKLITKFEKKLSALPENLQSSLLQLFKIWSGEIGQSLSDKDKQQFVGRLMQVYQEIEKDKWQSWKILWGLMKKVPSLEWTQFANISNIITRQADNYEYEMSVEDKAELAKLKKDIIQSEQRTQASEQRRKEAKEDIERFNRLNKVWEKIKIANNN